MKAHALRGLLTKIQLEVRWSVFWLSLGLFTVMLLLTALLPKVLGNIHHLFSRMPMIKPLITALLGVDPGNQISSELSQAFLWVHPTVLTLLWAHEVMYCSRVPAGEVDRGTADFLMCLPVSRWEIFVAETLGWLISGCCLLFSGYLGHLAASYSVQPDMRLSFSDTLLVMINLSAVYLAVGSLAFLVSAVSDRRGRAVGVVFAILLASFLLNFLAQFLDAAKSVSFLSVIAYYRPAIIIQTGQFPLIDVGILLGITGVLWTTAGICFSRRSICTV
jgi:ABC-type transport system involved in multi-copper enzyme maturation permease subunit